MPCGHHRSRCRIPGIARSLLRGGYVAWAGCGCTWYRARCRSGWRWLALQCDDAHNERGNSRGRHHRDQQCPLPSSWRRVYSATSRGMRRGLRLDVQRRRNRLGHNSPTRRSAAFPPSMSATVMKPDAEHSPRTPPRTRTAVDTARCVEPAHASSNVPIASNSFVPAVGAGCGKGGAVWASMATFAATVGAV